ncbi:RNA polymerase III subunit GL b [Girardinichthys multiradiatus]|uniref:RNA polymerase III subunit GL b n=1 Tax=Girardinichthys multiradiatus TaxID=208333 RepID=UPI001FABA1A4|nr:RNA polymerase III subunit GL b [Girardinichthys multiradiatus]
MMADRGRGRRTLSFIVDSVGISRGDSLPPAVQQPMPVFPVIEQKPLPLTGGEEAEYLTALKQDFRGAMRSLPCFIQPAAVHRDVERYSDKYHLSEQMDGLTDWIIDWKRFPKELRVRIRKPSRDGAALTCLGGGQSGEMKKKKVGEKEEVLLKLETLEKKEEQESSEEEGEGKNKQKEEEAEAEEEYDEEEFEEETDYIMSYFDNGEDFEGDSDDNMDEAIY